MEQEQILQSLSSQLGQTSLSERTLRDYVAQNLPSEGQEFDFEKHVKILTSLGGNFSRDVAQKVEEFKKNYKPSQKEPKADPEPNPEPTPEPSDIAKLLSRIEALENGAKESLQSNRKSQLLAQVEGMKDSLKVHNKALWKDCVAALDVTDDDSHDSLLKKAKEAYEKKLKDYFGAGAAPYGGKTSEQSESEKKEAQAKRDSLKAKLKAQGKL